MGDQSNSNSIPKNTPESVEHAARGGKKEAPLNLKPSSEFEEKRIVERWKIGSEQLYLASNEEEIHDALDELGSLDPGMDKKEMAQQLIKMDPEKRLIRILNGAELTPREKNFIEQQKISESGYRRNKRILNRIKNEDFEENPVPPKQLKLREEIFKQSRFRTKFMQQLEEALNNHEKLGHITPEEKMEVLKRVAESKELEEYIQGLEQKPDAQQELHGILKSTEGKTEEEVVLELITFEQKHELTPQAVQEKQTKDENAKQKEKVQAEKEKEEHLETILKLQPNQLQILGENKEGDLSVKVNGVVCGIDSEDFGIHWVKLDINGKEFIYDSPRDFSDEGNFKKELGLMRVSAALKYYNLPFDGIERDSFIEIWARETGDVQEFLYEEYDAIMEQGLIAFLEALTPDVGKKTTREVFSELGILNQNKKLNQNRLKETVKKWQIQRQTLSPQEFLEGLQSRG